MNNDLVLKTMDILYDIHNELPAQDKYTFSFGYALRCFQVNLENDVRQYYKNKECIYKGRAIKIKDLIISNGDILFLLYNADHNYKSMHILEFK